VSADNYGGHTPTWTAQTSTFACAVTTEKPQEAVRLGERLLDQTANYEITTGISVDLKVRDRIVIASTTYEIQGVQEKSTLSVTNHYWCSIVTGF
jgi:hypothetical protein